MKRIISLALVLVICCGLLAGCGGQIANEKAADAAIENATVSTAETALENATEAVEEVSDEPRTFTDDTGRIVTVPQEIKSIAVSGPLAQIYLISIASDMMVGCANQFSVEAEKYLSDELLSLPQLGQLYGGKGTMDLESLLAAAPDVVIDVGEAKGSIVEDLDGLTEQTGIPFIHIDASVEASPDAYRRIGELLGREEKAEEIALYLEGILDEVNSIMEKVDADNARKDVIYCLGDKGLNVLANGSYHAETLALVANNIAEVDDIVSSGAGNEVDMEQLMIWNPEFIVFAPDSVYSSVAKDATWQELAAISEGRYCRTPSGPYGWLQSPPAVQRYLGLIWLTSVLYPDYCTFNLQEKVAEYYEIFYGCELSDEDYALLTEDAFPFA